MLEGALVDGVLLVVLDDVLILDELGMLLLVAPADTLTLSDMFTLDELPDDMLLPDDMFMLELPDMLLPVVLAAAVPTMTSPVIHGWT